MPACMRHVVWVHDDWHAVVRACVTVQQLAKVQRTDNMRVWPRSQTHILVQRGRGGARGGPSAGPVRRRACAANSSHRMIVHVRDRFVDAACICTRKCTVEATTVGGVAHLPNTCECIPSVCLSIAAAERGCDSSTPWMESRIVGCACPRPESLDRGRR
jgi:hypothetical protein